MTPATAPDRPGAVASLRYPLTGGESTVANERGPWADGDLLAALRAAVPGPAATAGAVVAAIRGYVRAAAGTFFLGPHNLRVLGELAQVPDEAPVLVEFVGLGG